MEHVYMANTRMYDACPAAAELWSQLTDGVSRRSGVPLKLLRHPWPADMEELWSRPDLGLVFICGKPFRNAGSRHKPIAVPVTVESGTRYATHLLIREDRPWTRLEDSFGSRLGWTVAHSHSGYNALRFTLLPYALAGGSPRPLYRESVGPLDTPGRCLAALREGRADVVPLDGYFHALLKRHNPQALAGTRTLALSPLAPMPFLAAAPGIPDEVCAALSAALVDCTDSEFQYLLSQLELSGFASVRADDYSLLDHWERQALDAGYSVPA